MEKVRFGSFVAMTMIQSKLITRNYFVGTNAIPETPSALIYLALALLSPI
jgi:hypothetical protein